MENRHFKIIIIFFLISIHSCTSDHIEIIPSDIVSTISGPSNLKYIPDSINIDSDKPDSSTIPFFEGSLPFTYKIQVIPEIDSDKFTINSTGKIYFNKNIKIGSYKITVIVSNAADTILFRNAFKAYVISTLSPPSNYYYSVNSIEINEGDTIASEIPSINGTSPFTYAITSIPNSDYIRINRDGRIITAIHLPVGDFKISVVVTNKKGSIKFEDVYEIKVKPASVSEMVYTSNILYTMENNIGYSGIPLIGKGSKPIHFSIKTDPSIDEISINKFDGSISVSDEAPVGIYAVTVTATNIAGNSVFINPLSVNVYSSSSLPLNLTYTPNILEFRSGQIATGLAPSVLNNSSAIFNFSISPPFPGIHINSISGIIYVDGFVPEGVYDLSIIVTNNFGSTAFEKVFKLIVNSSTVSFSNEIVPIFESYNCTHPHCHNTINRLEIAIPLANKILDRISRNSTQNGFMPNGGTKLSKEEIRLISDWITTGLNP